MSGEVARSEEDLRLLWGIGRRRGRRVAVASLLGGTDVALITEDPGVGGAGIEEGADQLGWVADVHVGHVGVILQVILHDMRAHLLSRLVNRTVRNLINTALRISISRGLSWLSAALLFQLDLHAIDWLGLSELADARQVELEVALGLREINWFAVGANVARLLSHSFRLLNGLHIDGVGSILDGDEVE